MYCKSIYIKWRDTQSKRMQLIKNNYIIEMTPILLKDSKILINNFSHHFIGINNVFKIVY